MAAGGRIAMMFMMVCSAVVVIGGSVKKSSDILCTQVDIQLSPCVLYIEDKSMATPPTACCDGVKSVATLGQTKEDKVALCNCLKSALQTLIQNPIPDRVSGLPKACGIDNITLPPIQDKNFDCSTITHF